MPEIVSFIYIYSHQIYVVYWGWKVGGFLLIRNHIGSALVAKGRERRKKRRRRRKKKKKRGRGGGGEEQSVTEILDCLPNERALTGLAYQDDVQRCVREPVVDHRNVKHDTYLHASRSCSSYFLICTAHHRPFLLFVGEAHGLTEFAVKMRSAKSYTLLTRTTMGSHTAAQELYMMPYVVWVDGVCLLDSSRTTHDTG